MSLLRRCFLVSLACSALAALPACEGDGVVAPEYCPADALQCPDVGCVNATTNPFNCGACGAVCGEGRVCSQGVCSATCAAGETQCGASCTDLMSDFTNCGSCGTVCQSGQCNAGACAPLPSGAGGTGGSTGGTGGSVTGGNGGTGGATGGNGGTGGATGGTGGATGGTGGTGGATGGTGGGGAVNTCSTNGFVSSALADDLATEYAAWKKKYVQNCSDGSARVIRNTDGNDTVSEGIAYGMLLAAGNGDQTLLDKLWKFYKDRRNDNDVMHWKWSSCDAKTPSGQNGASDAELDAAMALIQAEKRWGGYKTDALALLDAVRDHETAVCSGKTVLKPGDAWGSCEDAYDKRVNPSYFAPGYYKVYAGFDTTHASFWNGMAADAYDLLATWQTKAGGGLFPDWAYADGGTTGGYGWEACRMPWRLATDYLWFGSTESKQMLDKMPGTEACSAHPKNSCFCGGFALTGMAKSQASLDSYVSSWMGNGELDDNPYYQATLRVLYMMTGAGLMNCAQ